MNRTTTCGVTFCRDAPETTFAIPGGQFTVLDVTVAPDFVSCSCESYDGATIEVSTPDGVVGSVRSRCFGSVGEIVHHPTVVGTGGGDLLLWYFANQSNPGGSTNYVNRRVLVVIREFDHPGIRG